MNKINSLSTDKIIIEQINAAIEDSQKILIVAHPRMDGDALGSLLGLYFLISENFKDKEFQLVSQTDYADELKFLPGSDLLVQNNDNIEFYDADVVITLDSGGFSRVSDVVNKCKPKHLINIDHHPSNDGFGTIVFVRPDMSSVGEMIFYMAQMLNWRVSEESSSNLYTAILTDTGNFTYSNTKESSFRAAAALVDSGADPAEIAANLYRNNSLSDFMLEARIVNRIQLINDELFAISYYTAQDITDLCCDLKDTNILINKIKSIRGTQIAALVMPGLQEGTVKVSLRGEGFHNLSQIAHELYDGGGHPRASGFTFKGTHEQAIAEVINTIAPLCKAKLTQIC
ncbi:MAG: bifunctional oligoribonuclease/PAP phosphatase NrnA [Candidatus Heimdallarchaeota archaeon]|nr:bifunctional oligoribonuclease/PAP phosphatase NrnA [Candidatus Heimdallarchaeota archaeon]